MNEASVARLAEVRREAGDTERQLADPEVVADQRRYVELSRRLHELAPIVAAADRHDELLGDLEAAKELFALSSGDDRELFREEIGELETSLTDVEEAIAQLLVPKDPLDDRNVIVEIRGAEGGEEANLFARDLYEMYRGFSERLGWKTQMMSSSPSELGGFSEVIFTVAGPLAWSRMKFEGGPHRVQRVPVTESQGRVHTSSATVAVLPEAEEVEMVIDANDITVDVFRASGPGGQSVNTTDSAVRLTHVPTGLVVSMQDEKSQLQNKAKAMVVLRSRLAERERLARNAEEAGLKKAQIGGGGRSEKIRTYNFKENRVSEHRLGLTTYNLDRVLAGDLTEISDALLADERARTLAGDQ